MVNNETQPLDQPTEEGKDLYLDEDSLIRGRVKVRWVELGEGSDGEYDENDPEDEELLRFDVLGWVDAGQEFSCYCEWHGVCEESGWYPFSDSSYCTQVPITATPEERRGLLKILMDEVYDAAKSWDRVKKVGEALSWMEIAWLTDPTARSRAATNRFLGVA